MDFLEAKNRVEMEYEQVRLMSSAQSLPYICGHILFSRIFISTLFA